MRKEKYNRFFGNFFFQKNIIKTILKLFINKNSKDIR